MIVFTSTDNVVSMYIHDTIIMIKRIPIVNAISLSLNFYNEFFICSILYDMWSEHYTAHALLQFCTHSRWMNTRQINYSIAWVVSRIYSFKSTENSAGFFQELINCSRA